MPRQGNTPDWTVKFKSVCTKNLCWICIDNLHPTTLLMSCLLIVHGQHRDTYEILGAMVCRNHLMVRVWCQGRPHRHWAHGGDFWCRVSCSSWLKVWGQICASLHIALGTDTKDILVDGQKYNKTRTISLAQSRTSCCKSSDQCFLKCAIFSFWLSTRVCHGYG